MTISHPFRLHYLKVFIFHTPAIEGWNYNGKGDIFTTICHFYRKLLLFLKSRRLEFARLSSTLGPILRVYWKGLFFDVNLDGWNLRDFQSHKFPFIIIVAGRKSEKRVKWERQYFIFMMPLNAFCPLFLGKGEVRRNICISSRKVRFIEKIPLMKVSSVIRKMMLKKLREKLIKKANKLCSNTFLRCHRSQERGKIN